MDWFHKIKTLFIFFDILVFFDFFEVEDNFVFEQFFECYTWCAKNISLRVIKVRGGPRHPPEIASATEPDLYLRFKLNIGVPIVDFCKDTGLTSA